MRFLQHRTFCRDLQ